MSHTSCPGGSLPVAAFCCYTRLSIATTAALALVSIPFIYRFIKSNFCEEEEEDDDDDTDDEDVKTGSAKYKDKRDSHRLLTAFLA